MTSMTFLILLLILTIVERSRGFVTFDVPTKTTTTKARTTPLWESPKPELAEPEQRVYGLLEDLHESKLAFRVVVVGNGAILESTSILGPQMKLSQSPVSGKNLVTFASDDSSFEFHLQTAAVSKIAMVEKEGPERTMRIMRFINDTGEPICSLILSEDSQATSDWYQTMVSKYGTEIQL